MISVGILVWYMRQNQVDVQVISDSNEITTVTPNLLVDIEGAVQHPGVYTLAGDARIKDALIAAGGLADDADRDTFAKTVNLAQKVNDGAKLYIPRQSTAGVNNVNNTVDPKSTLLSINTASLSDLDALPGVGVVRAQAIIDGRPYTKIEELVENKILPQSVFQKIKESISVY